MVEVVRTEAGLREKSVVSKNMIKFLKRQVSALSQDGKRGLTFSQMRTRSGSCEPQNLATIRRHQSKPASIFTNRAVRTQFSMEFQHTREVFWRSGI